MSQIANIVAFDGASTPVSHTFVAISVSKEKDEVVALWREQNLALPVNAQGSVWAKMKRLPTGIWRTAIRVEIPVMESISGQNAAGYTAAPAVAFIDTVECVGYFHGRSAPANHRLVRQLIINIMGNISTTVAAATTGPAPELFDLLVAPT